MPTFKTKFTGVPTAKIAVWLDLTEAEYEIIQSMAAGNQSAKQLLQVIAEKAIREAIDAKKKSN
jgi:hypothetical protein